MDNHKILNFTKDNPGIPFPAFRALTSEQVKHMRTRVCHRLGLHQQSAPLEIVRTLSKREGVALGKVPENGRPSLSTLQRYLRIEPKDVFINWYRFDEVDAFDMVDLFKWFDYVWYPGVDDIEIFDGSCSWFLVVSHDGDMTLVQV